MMYKTTILTLAVFHLLWIGCNSDNSGVKSPDIIEPAPPDSLHGLVAHWSFDTFQEKHFRCLTPYMKLHGNRSSGAKYLTGLQD